MMIPAMPIDYDEFRRTTWEERIVIFNALSSEGKAELFRSQVAGWLERHRAELSPLQIEILEQTIEVTTPEIYTRPQSAELRERLKVLEARALAVLTKEQVRDALTMQWGLT
jgi:hypothetical protein